MRTGVVLLLAGAVAAALPGRTSAMGGERIGGLELPAERILPWRAGIPGGIPKAPARADARRFGARGDGKADDWTAIQKAIDSVKAPGAVTLPAGTYLVRKPVKLRSGVVLRGAGPDKTHIRIEYPEPGTAGIQLYGDGVTLGDEAAVGRSRHIRGFKIPRLREEMTVHVDGDIAAGSATVRAKTGGLKAGMFVALYCDNDAEVLYTDKKWDADWAHHCVGQMLKVKAVRGRGVTFDRPIRLTYKSDLKPRLLPLGMIERAGVEDLHVWRANDKETINLEMAHASECWIKNVHSEWAFRGHVWIRKARDCEVRDSLFHHAYDYGGGGHGYGVVMEKWATDNLVENNVFHYLRHAIMVKQGATGNIFGYNASYFCKHNCDISLHGHWPNGNLFEGNVVQRIVSADWWGPTGPKSTFFRNRVEMKSVENAYNMNQCIQVLDKTKDSNVIANTLMSGNVFLNDKSNWIEMNLYLKARPWPKGRSDLFPTSAVPAGNIPASLYLATKPSWWGDHPWPAVGADADLAAVKAGRPMVPIPAEGRYRRIERTLARE